MDSGRYDVVVIGSGPAGGIVARKCHKAGLDVAIVECNGWGGVCPLRGCEPKKVLADAAHAVLRLRDMAGNGPVGNIRLDWPELMRFKRSLIDPIPLAVHDSLQKSGIDVIGGEARITAPGHVVVPGHGALEAGVVVIATGARPRAVHSDGADLLMTSDAFLEMDSLPESLVFLGGGFIALEFAGIAAAAGAAVTIVHRSDKVLRGFDQDLAARLVESMKDAGVGIHFNQEILHVAATDTGVRVHTRHAGDGSEISFDAHAAVSGMGRVPNIDGLGLDEAGIEANSDGILVNSRMQSVSDARVYAVGDCAESGLPLTTTAVLQAEVAVKNILGETEAEVDLTGTASVVFTHPSLAAVGLSAESAQERGEKVVIHAGDASSWSEHKRLGLGHAGYKVIEHAQSGRILGAHYLGQHAEEVINIFGMAIRHGLTRKELLQQPWAYPSFGYAVRYMLT